MALIIKSNSFPDGSALKLIDQMDQLLHGQAFVFISGRMLAATHMMHFYAQEHTSIALQDNSSLWMAAAALHAGLSVYLVDSAPNDPSMGYESLKHTLNKHKDITLVGLEHVGGYVAKDYLPISNLVGDRELTMVEDCSTILGVSEEDYLPGTSDASLYAFDETSSVQTSTAATMVATRNLELRDYLKKAIDGDKELRVTHQETKEVSLKLSILQDTIKARRNLYNHLLNRMPCLLNTPSTYLTFPTTEEHVSTQDLVQATYQVGNQLHDQLKDFHVVSPALPNSYQWAKTHRNIPLSWGFDKDQKM